MNSSVSKVRHYKLRVSQPDKFPTHRRDIQSGGKAVYCFNCSGKPFKRVYLETFLKMLFPIFLGKQHLPKRNFICGAASLSSRDRKIQALYLNISGLSKNKIAFRIFSNFAIAPPSLQINDRIQMTQFPEHQKLKGEYFQFAVRYCCKAQYRIQMSS